MVGAVIRGGFGSGTISEISGKWGTVDSHGSSKLLRDHSENGFTLTGVGCQPPGSRPCKVPAAQTHSGTRKRRRVKADSTTLAANGLENLAGARIFFKRIKFTRYILLLTPTHRV